MAGRLEPRDLFLFVGAGASRSMPSGRPLFRPIRNAILGQLRLARYIPPANPPYSDQQEVVEGLAPEPFLHALMQSFPDGVGAIERWLQDVLGGGASNAAHVAIAKLARAGAPTWTVNFDHAIEDALSPPLRVCAWPSVPSGAFDLAKPHGTLGGRLIASSPQVIAGLPNEWIDRLRTDVAGRTIVFLGYSGNDVDLQPLWQVVGPTAHQVLWFDHVDSPEMQRRERMLGRGPGSVSFLPGAGGPSNPSVAFVEWCIASGLADVDAGLVSQLDDDVPSLKPPALPGNGRALRGAVQQVVGDADGARRQYLAMAAVGPNRVDSARRYLAICVNHGGRPTLVGLAVFSCLPPLGPLRRFRDYANRKRASIRFNLGHHRAVLRSTRNLDARSVSTLRVLRAGSLRMTASLDESIAAARDALESAKTEQHVVRAANASLQLGIALVWAGRLDEAELHLQHEARPLGSVTDTRWVAWADFLEAQLHIHRRRAAEASDAIERGLSRFRAEGLLDGVLSLETIRLTVDRLRGDDPSFELHLQQLRRFSARRRRSDSGRLYAKRHAFSKEAIQLEEAEFARVHTRSAPKARALYKAVARSQYPVHAALAALGLAYIEADRGGDATTHANEAVRLGELVDAALVVTAARRVHAGDPPEELFFP